MYVVCPNIERCIFQYIIIFVSHSIKRTYDTQQQFTHPYLNFFYYYFGILHTDTNKRVPNMTRGANKSASFNPMYYYYYYYLYQTFSSFFLGGRYIEKLHLTALCVYLHWNCFWKCAKHDVECIFMTIFVECMTVSAAVCNKGKPFNIYE